MNTTDKVKEKALIEGFLVPHADEDKFSKENKIKVTRLHNGAKILSGQRLVSDSRISTVSYNLLTGSYFDPKGYEGSHHFMEHLFFSKALREKYHKNLIEANAFTSQDKIVFYNRGSFNPNVKNYGLTEVMEDAFQSLILPENLHDETTFGYAKEIIIREIDEFYADYQKYMFDELMKHLLLPENPYYTNALGTYESVANTTSKTIEDVLKKRVSSKNIIAAVFSEGNGDEYLKLTEKVTGLLEKFPRTHKVDGLTWEQGGLMQEIKQGSDKKISIPLPSNIVSVNHVWKLDIEYLSQEDVIMSLLGSFLGELFNIEGRNRGLGYSLYFFPRFFYPDKMLLCASVLTPKENLEIIKKRMVETIDVTFNKPLQTPSLIDALLETEKSRQLADPISTNGRLSVCFESLRWFDHLFDNTRMRKEYLNIKPNDIKRVLETLKNTPAAVYTVGNF